MAPGGYTPTYDASTDDTCIIFDWSYGITATNSCYPVEVDEDAAKAARRAWLLFTRGNGWTDGSPVRSRVGVRVRRCSRIVPGLRGSRRAPRRIRWFTLKQLRRRGLI